MTMIDKTAAALGAAALRTAMSLRMMKTQVEAENAVKGVMQDNVKAAMRMVEGRSDARKPDPRHEVDYTA